MLWRHDLIIIYSYLYVYVIYRKQYECDECNEVTYEVNVMSCSLVTFLGQLDFKKESLTICDYVKVSSRQNLFDLGWIWLCDRKNVCG